MVLPLPDSPIRPTISRGQTSRLTRSVIRPVPRRPAYSRDSASIWSVGAHAGQRMRPHAVARLSP